MDVIKKSADYTIYQKRSNRYAVKDANNRWVHGDDKVKILLAEKLVKAPAPKPKEEPAAETAEETPAQE
ncbi:MAG: hypothetical protein LJE85_13115 [Gammaproteobacteria bacterium]|nr:hypothetical protein [Gammaproteobacteria bacterium]